MCVDIPACPFNASLQQIYKIVLLNQGNQGKLLTDNSIGTIGILNNPH